MESRQERFLNATFVSGLITGAINKFLVHPFDTIKAYSQVNIVEYNSIKTIQSNGVIAQGRRILQ